MHSICRLCLGEKVELIYVFESKGIPDWSAADAIIELLNIQVSTGDKYPQCVCIECMMKLEHFKQFKNQCEINKGLLDRLYERNRGVSSNEERMETELCSDVKERDFYLEEKYVEISIREDPLALNDGAIHIKREVGENSNDYNETTTSEVIGTADHASIQMKSEFTYHEDNSTCKNVLDPDVRIKQEPLDIAVESNSDGYLEECIRTGATDAEVTPQVCYNTDFSERKEGFKMTDDALDDRFSQSGKDYRGPIGVSSFSEMEDTAVFEVTEPIPSNSCSRGVSADESTNPEDAGGRTRVYMKPYSCKLCDRGFQRKDFLVKHKCSVKCESAKRRGCPKEFPPDSDPAIREVDDGNAFECLEKLDTADDLGEHTLVHSRATPFQCTECGKRFGYKANLKTHMLTHSGVKAFRCTECHKSFSLNENLKRHMVVHTGERPFQCHQCGYKFTRKGSLDSHVLKHFVEKPFSCNRCSKSFAQKASLLRHIQTH